jgi:hypothetical protein
MRQLVALIASLSVCAAVSAGEIYSWKDKDGRINYSDVPPPAPNQSRTMGSTESTRPARAEGATQRSPADLEVEFRKREAQKNEAAAKEQKKLAEAEGDRANCEQARNALSGLESGQRIARFNAAGEREYLDDAQIAAEIERARKAVASWCK